MFLMIYEFIKKDLEFEKNYLTKNILFYIFLKKYILHFSYCEAIDVNVSVCVPIYIYIHTLIHIYIYIYI